MVDNKNIKLKILKLIEKGRINAEEAQTILDLVDSEQNKKEDRIRKSPLKKSDLKNFLVGILTVGIAGGTFYYLYRKSEEGKYFNSYQQKAREESQLEELLNSDKKMKIHVDGKILTTDFFEEKAPEAVRVFASLAYKEQWAEVVDVNDSYVILCFSYFQEYFSENSQNKLSKGDIFLIPTEIGTGNKMRHFGVALRQFYWENDYKTPVIGSVVEGDLNSLAMMAGKIDNSVRLELEKKLQQPQQLIEQEERE